MMALEEGKTSIAERLMELGASVAISNEVSTTYYNYAVIIPPPPPPPPPPLKSTFNNKEYRNVTCSVHAVRNSHT